MNNTNYLYIIKIVESIVKFYQILVVKQDAIKHISSLLPN
jgi:hypothetical protein